MQDGVELWEVVGILGQFPGRSLVDVFVAETDEFPDGLEIFPKGEGTESMLDFFREADCGGGDLRFQFR